MRMQLIRLYIVLCFLVFKQDLKSQVRKMSSSDQDEFINGDTTEVLQDSYESLEWKAIDFNLLSSYYQQDGNNAAVTGGIGSEALTDFTQKVSLTVPLNKKLSVKFDGGYDYYSSVSTDNIDNVRSSDSSSDIRAHGNIGFSYQLEKQKNISGRIGTSNEYDYFSINSALFYDYKTEDENTTIQLGFQTFQDRWSVIYPREIKNSSSVPTNKRSSYNASFGLSKVINRKMQLFIQLEGTYMNGLLSTPFHRVYFTENSAVKIEKLPSNRLKIPIGIRFNAYLNDWMLARLHYRYYWDSWGIQANTLSAELPLKINRFFAVYPFLRFHSQQAADYFKPYKEHNLQDEYYTSDYDLSKLNSLSYGLGLSYSPAGGIAKFNMPLNQRKFMFKSIDLKYSHYDRSTGLKADIISVGLGFTF